MQLPLPEPVLELGRKTFALGLPLRGWGLPISTFSTGGETLGPSYAESFRDQEIQVHIYPKAAASAGLWLYLPSLGLFYLKAPAWEAGEKGPQSWGPSCVLGHPHL